MVSILLLSGTPVCAQITPDRTLGAESSRLTPNVQIKGASAERIDGGAQRGSNLFHSFSQFNINNGQRVYFVNPNGVQNILTRVTGKSASNILGTLGVFGNANLFLLNPNGILFGQNARLDLGGSFVGTTANAIRFGEQGIFSATVPQAPPLLTVNPSALLFNQLHPEAITNQSQARAGISPAGQNVTGLRVPDTQSLLLVGGNINLDGGGLRAYGGNIELAGLAAPGNVSLNQVAGNNLSLAIPDNVERADVSLSNQAEANVRGAGGGTIKIQARNVNMAGESILRAGIDPGLGTPNSLGGNIEINATGATTLSGDSTIANVVLQGAFGKAGDINIKSGSVTISDATGVNTFTYGQGDAGSIFIQSGSFTLRDDAQLSASTFGQGNAGSIFIQASDAASLTSAEISSSVERGGVGNGGTINIHARSLTLSDGTQLVTLVRQADETRAAGRGNAGNVNLDVQGALTITGVNNGYASGISSRVDTGTTGNGGNINIKSGSLALSDGARLIATTLGQGDAGSVFIQVSDAVSLTGKDTAIFSNVDSGGVGNGGDINIKAGSLTLTDGAELQTSVNSAFQTHPSGRGKAGNVNVDAQGAVTIAGTQDTIYSGIISKVQTGATGNGGNIRIKSGSFTLRDGAGLQASTSGQGNAGNVFIQASDTVSVANGATILTSVESGAIGNGGAINIQARNFSLTNDAELSSSSSGQGSAGDITANLGSVRLDNQGTVAALTNSGNGGNINLTAANNLLLRRNSNISTTAGENQFGGNGGNITINTPFIVALPQENSHISANAYLGKGGNVRISAQGIFGIQALKQPTLSSDITASSQLGVQGQIAITQPEVQPTQGLVALPAIVLDSSNQIAQTCPKGTAARPLGEFIVSGRGSLPPNPLEPLAGTPNLSPLATLAQSRASAQPIVSPTPDASSPALVEAQGWIKDSNGTIVLVAAAPKVTPYTRPTATVCPVSKQ